jgi:hypothetical protein
MKKQTKESYEEWVRGLETKLAASPEKLEHFRSIIADESIATYVAGSVMAEKEFYRRTNDVVEKEKTLAQLETENQARYNQLTNDAIELKKWADTVSPQVDAAVNEARYLREREALAMAKLKEFGLEGELANTKPVGDPVAVTADNPLWGEIQVLRQRQAMMDANFPAAIEQMATVLTRSHKEGFDFDPKELIKTASQNNVDLNRAYELQTAEARAAKLKVDIDKRIEAARAEGERQALTRLSSPDRLGATRAIPDQFTGGDGANKLTQQPQRVDRAVEEFMKLGPEAFQGF